MQKNDRENFVLIKKGDSLTNFFIRFFMFLYVLIFAIFYNVFELLTVQNGYHVLSNGEIVFFAFAIWGSILCFFFRFIIFIRVAQDIKNKIYQFIMMASQILCVVVFLICQWFLLDYTKGVVDWNYLRIYLDFELFLLCVVFVQWTTYLACLSWMKFLADKDRIIKFCCAFGFLSGLILTWVFCQEGMRNLKMMMHVILDY